MELTEQELEHWEQVLRDERLSMKRGTHSSRLVYGWNGNRNGLRASVSWSTAWMWVKQARKSSKPRKTTPAICQQCQRPFEARSAGFQRYCSALCRKHAFRARRRVERLYS